MGLENVAQSAVRRAAVAGYVALANMLTSNFTPTCNGSVRITFSVADAGIAYFYHNGQLLKLNDGNPIRPNEIYEWCFGVSKSDTFNLRFSANTTINLLLVENFQGLQTP